MLEGKKRAAHSSHDLIMQAAWTAASLGRVKKIPALERFLITPAAPAKKKTWEELYAIGLAWAQAAGEVLPHGGAA